MEYAIPARFDDSEVPGILPTVCYIDLREKTPVEFADLICRKIQSALESENADKNSLPSKGTRGRRQSDKGPLISVTEEPPNIDQKEAKYEKAMNRLKKFLEQYITEFKFPGNIIDEATKENAFKIRPARAIIFGHTGVGKTTTINKLLERDILSASGQLTCTRSLAAAQHRGGLIFYDSPGIGDKPKQENITRVALSVDQLEEERVSTIRLLDMTETHQEGPKNFTKLDPVYFTDEIKEGPLKKNIMNQIVGKKFQLSQFRQWQSRYPFDFAVFLMSSEKGLSYGDTKLIKNFFLAHQNMVMFKVFNIFHNRYRSDIAELEPEIKIKLDDAKNRLKEAGLANYDNWIVIDSKNGHGMESFVTGFGDCLPVEVLKNLTKVLKQEYSHLIQKKFDQYFFDYLAHIASLVAVFPVDHSAGRRKFLNLTLESLAIMAEFMSPDKNAQAARPFVNDIINQIEIMSTRPQYASVKQYRWPGIMENAQDFFGLYNLKKERSGEYFGIGGINSIKYVLSLGLVINQIFRGHSIDENEFELLLRTNKEKIDLQLNRVSDHIKRITNKAGRRTDKDDKIELADQLYPHIQKILAA